MKGNNTLELCPLTVIEALQEYLDKRFVPTARVKVESVEMRSGAGSTFVVKVTDVAQVP